MGPPRSARVSRDVRNPTTATDETPVFPPLDEWFGLIRLGVEEDLGGAGVDGDVTSRLTIPEGLEGRALLVQKAPGVTCGLPAVGPVCRLLDERLHVEWPDMPLGEGTFKEAASRHPEELLQISGPVRSILAAERLVLNLLGHMGGVATLTRQFARRCEGTRARIYDTRKTRPGYRALDKYAVLCGGGANHRLGLHDMVLVKDNHLALAGVVSGKALAEAVADLVVRSKAERRSGLSRLRSTRTTSSSVSSTSKVSTSSCSTTWTVRRWRGAWPFATVRPVKRERFCSRPAAA